MIKGDVIDAYVGSSIAAIKLRICYCVVTKIQGKIMK
jgi:hypothetical protein